MRTSVHLLIVTSSDTTSIEDWRVTGQLIAVQAYASHGLAEASARVWKEVYDDIETEVRGELVREDVALREHIKK